MLKDSEAQLINVITKDIGVFTDGSWCLPYLVVVPINTIVSAVILVKMFGPVVILSYIMMAALLLLQYVSNKKLAILQYQNFQVTDQRIALVLNIIHGIKQIKIRM